MILRTLMLLLALLLNINSYSQLDILEIDGEDFNENNFEKLLDDRGFRYIKNKTNEYVKYDFELGLKEVKFNKILLNNLHFNDLDISEWAYPFGEYRKMWVKLLNDGEGSPFIAVSYQLLFGVEIALIFETNFANPGSIYSSIQLKNVDQIKSNFLKLKKISVISYVPDPPLPEPDLSSSKQKHTTPSLIDEIFIAKLIENQQWAEGTKYLDSIININENDYRAAEVMMILLRKQGKVLETFPFVRKQVELCENDLFLSRLVEELGSLSILTKNEKFWIEFKPRRKELKGDVKYRFLLRFHDFLATTFINNKMDSKEYKSLYDAAKVIRLSGWDLESMKNHILTSTLNKDEVDKIIIMIDELNVRKKNIVQQN